jgi:SWI/SNF-related matrix-associated actin-dependent regulator 1 of chromatin subfamily A
MSKTTTLARNQDGELVVKISFPYDLDLILKVRELPGRKYHAQEKCWSAPMNTNTINTLKELGFSLSEKIQQHLEKEEVREAGVINAKITGLKGVLRPFQSKGVAIIDRYNGNALLADDQGLGKTIEVIAYLQLHPELRPAVVICPAFLKLNWEKECHAWMPYPNTVILKGTTPYKFKGDIIIINYDILNYWYSELRKRDPKIIVMDECQYIKSPSAKRTKAMKMLVKGINSGKMGLSGTPLENRPAELFNAISIINPVLFPNRWHYLQRYCAPKHNGFGWNFNGAANIPELHRILMDTIMIRRKKSDVLKDLPDKVYSYIPMELTNNKEYREAENDFIKWVREKKGAEAAKKASNAIAFSSIEALKQLAVRGKLKQSMEWIQDFLESEKKLVVFATHHFVIDELINEFSTIVVQVDGRVSLSDRQKAVDRFQNDSKVKLFVGNIEAAGVGITLTAASDVIFLELPWTPAKLVQASDRVHRIGQKNAVNIYFLLSAGTIEEKIAKLLDQKLKVVTAVLDGNVLIDETSLLYELMKSYE